MRRKGFTLIELLVVLAIIGVMLSLVPMAFRSLPGLEAKVAARELADVFRAARGVAIRDNREEFVTFDVDQRLYRRGSFGQPHQIGDGIEVSLITARSEQADQSTGRIRFFPDGTSTGGQVTLAGRGGTFYVRVDWLSGSVEIAR